MTIKDILLSAGYRITMETGEYYKMRPLYRQSSSNNALSVNKKTGHFTDFVTGEKGSIEKLIRLTTGGSIEFEPEVNKIDDLKEEVQIRFNKEEIKALLPSYGFYNKRGISDETLKTFQSGYCSYGKMNDRYVFPILNPDGELVGLNGRAMRESTSPNWIKWKILGRRTSFVYPLYFNKEYIQQSRKLILVESTGNMLALWESGIRNTLVTFGTSISKKLLAAILSLNPLEIVVSMDNDEKNNNPGQKASDKIVKELEKWFDKSQIKVKVSPLGLDWGDVLKSQGRESLLELWK